MVGNSDMERKSVLCSALLPVLAQSAAVHLHEESSYETWCDFIIAF